jgi:hypothetical protein
MKTNLKGLILFIISILLIACSTYPDRYNTQRGAAIGAGVGALAGAAFGNDGQDTLLGAGLGTLVGAILGNAVDQRQLAIKEAAITNKRIVYYDNRGGAIEAIPGPVDQHTKCRKVTKRQWNNGQLITESVEEICEGEKSSSYY